MGQPGVAGRAATTCAVALLLGGCNAIFGFHEGSPLEPSQTTAGGQGGVGGGGAGPAGGDGGAAAPWLAGYGWRKQVTIHADVIDESLANFVVGVIVDADAELAARAMEDGADIGFTSDDGTTMLASEIELFEPDSGRLAAWVHVPLLSDAEDTVLWLYYGNPSRPPSTAGDTWGELFHGVWHLSPDESGSPTLTSEDSSSYGNDGSSDGVNVMPSQVPGVAGTAYSFGANDWVNFGHPSNGSLDFGLGSFSYSLWVLASGSTTAIQHPWAKGAVFVPEAGYSVEIRSAGWRIVLDDGASEKTANFGPAAEFDGAWTYLTAVVDRSLQEARVYANGEHRYTVDIAALSWLSTASAAQLGAPEPYVGLIDEVRVYGIALTDAWIAAEYANLDSPAQFFTLGAEQRAP